MKRLFEGRPIRVERGRVSLQALADEAGVDLPIKLAQLQQGRYKDLGRRLIRIKDASTAPFTSSEIQLASRLDRVVAEMADLQDKYD